MTVAQQYQNPIVSYDTTCTILSGQTQSNDVSLGGLSLVGLILPAALTSLTMYAQMTEDLTSTAGNVPSGNWHPVYDTDGTQIIFTVGASRYVSINPANFAGVYRMRLVGASAEAADRSIIVVTRPV